MRRSALTLIAVAFLVASSLDAQPTTVILVRHAEKASPTDADPALSDAGTRRAKELAVALGDAHVSSVIVTQFQRTRLTAAPLIDATGASMISIENSGSTASHIAAVAAAVRARHTGETVLVVGHSNTVTGIIAALGGPMLANLCDSQYSMLFILEMSGSGSPRLIRASYGSADPTDAACPKTAK